MNYVQHGIRGQHKGPNASPNVLTTTKQVNMVIRELTTNLMAVSCPWGHSKGHLGLLQDPAIYLTRNRGAFDIPAKEPQLTPTC